MGWILSGMMLLVLAGIVILNLFRGKKRGVVRTGISVCILIASAFFSRRRDFRRIMCRAGRTKPSAR